MRSSICVPAAIEPITGGEALVAAPADGRYASARLPSVGDRVSAGRSWALEPRLASGGEDRASLEAAMTEPSPTLDAARADLARAERLLEERAVPGRRVEDARRAVAVAEARVTAARARLAQRDEVSRAAAGTRQECLRSPRADWRSGRRGVRRTGASYTGRNAALPHRAWRPRRVAGANPAGRSGSRTEDRPVSHGGPGQELSDRAQPDQIDDAGVVDPKTRALPLQIEVANQGGQLLVGQTGTAILYTGTTERMPVVRKRQC